MPSRYSEDIKAIAIEEDPEKRLELSAKLDTDVEELDERFSMVEDYEAALNERDAAIRERDEWKTRYADRFFDSEPIRSKQDPKPAPKLGYQALWD